jgi:uncharacterized membrane protein YdfJ with MMPL/SSD domain
LGANLAVLAVAGILAVGAPDRLGIGSLALDEGGSPHQPDLVIATTGGAPVRSGVYRVALRVISAQVRSDADVTALRQGGVSANGRSTSLRVFLASGDDAPRQRAVQRIESGIDPGPLRVSYGGETATLLAARHDLSGELWKLELLALPFIVLILVGALGPRLAVAPVICAATAVTGALAGLRVAGAFADVSLLGIAPAAVVGLALGVEAACLMIARYRDEVTTAAGGEGLGRAIEGAATVALPLAAAATAATAGLLATGLDQAPSMLLACALAAAFALGSALVAVPAVLVLVGPHTSEADGRIGGEPRLGRLPHRTAGFLAGSWRRTALAGGLAVALMVAAAAPLLHAESRPFPRSSLAAASSAGSLFSDLPLAAGVSAAAVALVLVVVFRSGRVVPAAIVSLLPAAAACGLCVLVFQDGHLAGAIGQHRQAALETGAVASLLAVLAAVSAARAVSAVRSSRDERSLGVGLVGAAESAAALTVPAAIVATLVAGAATGMLAGTDLYPAREFGLAVAAGLLIDIVLLRTPLVAALARWGGG